MQAVPGSRFSTVFRGSGRDVTQSGQRSGWQQGVVVYEPSFAADAADAAEAVPLLCAAMLCYALQCLAQDKAWKRVVHEH